MELKTRHKQARSLAVVRTRGKRARDRGEVINNAGGAAPVCSAEIHDAQEVQHPVAASRS
jgi:hypothetical protein